MYCIVIDSLGSEAGSMHSKQLHGVKASLLVLFMELLQPRGIEVVRGACKALSFPPSHPLSPLKTH